MQQRAELNFVHNMNIVVSCVQYTFSFKIAHDRRHGLACCAYHVGNFLMREMNIHDDVSPFAPPIAGAQPKHKPRLGMPLHDNKNGYAHQQANHSEDCSRDQTNSLLMNFFEVACFPMGSITESNGY